MYRQMGHRKGIALGLRASAARANLIGDMPAEARLLRDALDEFADLGVPSGIVGCLEDCGRHLVAARKAELAVTLWAVAERNRERLRIPLSPAEEELIGLRLTAVRHQLPASGFEAADAVGRSMDLADAVSLALSALEKAGS